MAKSPIAMSRLYTNVFVCRKCKTKLRSNMRKILQKKVACRRCGSKYMRPIKKGK